LFSLFQMVGMAVTGLLMIFYPMITRHITRRKLMDILMVVSFIGYSVMLLPGIILAKGAVVVAGYDLKFILVTLGYMLANFGQYGFYLIMMISIMNTVEYNELKHGTRDEGIVSSLRPFLTKLASALTVVIASTTYLLTGVTKYTNQISSLENAAASGHLAESDKLTQIHSLLQGVTHSQSLGLLLVMILLPAALMLLSYVLYLRHYKLDEPEYDRICAELKERKARRKL
jgi:melibiose permease/lactose/raffinose/galactose permease